MVKRLEKMLLPALKFQQNNAGNVSLVVALIGIPIAMLGGFFASSVSSAHFSKNNLEGSIPAISQLNNQSMSSANIKKPAYIYRARITQIYDGDTLKADIDLGFDTWLKNKPLRLYNI
ncbi:MAG TPA: hypothetical protein ENJ42_01020, partial [Hellea balneolensis]|nr:hypothetical protein [Hellea balneolensis]